MGYQRHEVSTREEWILECYPLPLRMHPLSRRFRQSTFKLYHHRRHHHIFRRTMPIIRNMGTVVPLCHQMGPDNSQLSRLESRLYSAPPICSSWSISNKTFTLNSGKNIRLQICLPKMSLLSSTRVPSGFHSSRPRFICWKSTAKSCRTS